MNIGIDIDGVMTDVLKFIKEKGKIFLNREIVDENGLDISDIFAVDKSLEEDFWNEYFLEYLKTAPALEGVGKITRRLKEEGNNIYVVTARYFHPEYDMKDEEELHDITKNFLKKNGIYYDELIFAKPPKIKEVENLKIDAFIEDTPSNIHKLAKVTEVLIMDAPYNRVCSVPHTKRVHDWNEIYAAIEEMSK